MVVGSLPLLSNLSEATIQQTIKVLTINLKLKVEDIRRYETESELIWNSFEYIYFFYEPDFSKLQLKMDRKFELIQHVYKLSVDVLLLCLLSAVGSKQNANVILSGSLEQYIVMLPWNVPSESQEQAVCVVREFTGNCTIQPPSLSCIAKATVAKASVGLKSIVETESISHLIHKFDSSFTI